MKVVVERYHGLGNDYLVFDPNHNELKLDEANVIRTEVNLRPVEMVSAFLQNI